MPNLSNEQLRHWSEALLELGRLRLAAEVAPADQGVVIDLSPFKPRPGTPTEARATVFEMRRNLDMLIEDLIARIRDGYVHKLVDNPFPDHNMMLVVLLARKLADENKQAPN